MNGSINDIIQQTPPEAPTFLLKILSAESAKSTVLTSEQNGQVTAGCRNDYLTSKAGSMRRAGLSIDSITAALHQENISRCDPPLENKEVDQIIRSISKYPGPDNETWPPTKPLPPIHEKTVPLSEELVPEPFRSWTLDISHRLQVPFESVATMAIALFSGVVGRRCTIRPKALDSWTVTPNLWGAIVAPPGFMKTPIFKELRKATNQIETILKKENKEAFCKYETDKMEHAILKKAAQDSFKKKRSDPSTQDNNHLIDPAVLMEPTAPPNKYLVVNDTSSEKLATLLKDNPKGLILYRDELSGLLLSFEKQGRESDRAFYLETWDGSSSFSVHRIGRGDTQIENMCLSIIGGIQPEPLEQYFYKTLSAGTGDDGLLSRFQLLIYPECRKPTYVDCHPNLDALKTVIEIFKMVYETSFSSSGFLQDDDGPPFIRFDNDAQNFFKSWFESNCELTSSDSGNSSALIAHFTKYKKLMPALSLLFYIIDQLHKGSPARFSTIPLSCAQRAASWCSCLESHAKKIYGGLVKPELKIAHALASKILNGQLTSGLTVKDIYRRHWSGLTDRKLIYLGLDVLSEHKWLKLVQPESTGGRKASPTVIINPQLTKEGSNEESDTAT